MYKNFPNKFFFLLSINYFSSFFLSINKFQLLFLQLIAHGLGKRFLTSLQTVITCEAVYLSLQLIANNCTG